MKEPELHAVLVCGSREWTDRTTILGRLKRYPRGTILIHGACGHFDEKHDMLVGADRIAADVGEEIGHCPLSMPAPWKKRGNAAGPMRDRLMVEVLARLRWCGYLTFVEAFPMPSSRGTWITVRYARKMHFPVTVNDP